MCIRDRCDPEACALIQQNREKFSAYNLTPVSYTHLDVYKRQEYDEMNEMLDQYRDKFERVAVAEPLLGEVGADASVINTDKEAVAKAVTAAAVKDCLLYTSRCV